MKKSKTAKILAACLTGLFLVNGCGSASVKETEAGTEEKAPEQTIDATLPGEAAGSDGAADSDEILPMRSEPATGRQEPMETQDYGTPEEGAMRVMTLSDSRGNLFYVDVNVGTFFTAPIPDDLTDADGNALTPEDIKAGCVVDIYGDGIMLESYPGQYPGASKMVLIKAGTQEDAAPYQYLVDEVSMPADPAEPPSMNAEYRTELTETAVMLTRGGYQWNYTDENGKGQHVIADASHILHWPELNDIRIDESIPSGLELTLSSFRKPQSVAVTRFPLDSWDKDATVESEMVPGEAVETQDTDEGYTMVAEAGYVYLIEAKWEEGQVEFGFYTK